MFDFIPKEAKERIEKEGSLDKFVSAFLSLAQDLIDSGEADEILENDKGLDVFESAFSHRKTKQAIHK